MVARRNSGDRKALPSMKLASLKSGRDGSLVVVSRNLAHCVAADGIALTLQAALDSWGDTAPRLKQLNWLATDRIADSDGAGWNPPLIRPDTLAMLQYTSGSTGTPKGVMLSHANLMHNVQIICYSFEPSRKSSGMSWLPTYHDMGLVAGVLQAVFRGKPLVLLSPLALIRRPFLWLRAVTHYDIDRAQCVQAVDAVAESIRAGIAAGKTS